MKKLFTLLVCAFMLVCFAPARSSAQDAPAGIGGVLAQYADVVAARDYPGMGKKMIEQFLPGVFNYLANTLRGTDGGEREAEAVKAFFDVLGEEQAGKLADYVMERYCREFPHHVGNEELFEFFGAAVYEWYAAEGRSLTVDAAARLYAAATEDVNASVNAIIGEFAVN